MADQAGELRLFAVADSPLHEQHQDAEATRSKTGRAITTAAQRLRMAESHFETAIQAGRRAGLTWRQIGVAAGLPFQTIHRRASHNAVRLTQVDESVQDGHGQRRCNR